MVFSQARVPEGQFGLKRLFARTTHACLFLNCSDRLWYLGLDRAIDQAVDTAIAKTRPRRIIYYGASKGANGALLTGLRRNDGAIYAFGPEFALGRPGTQNARTLGPDLRDFPDLIAGIRRKGHKHPIHIAFGIFDPVDASGAVDLLDLVPFPTVLRLVLLRSTHASHDHLYSLNIIRKLIGTFNRDLQAECAARGLIADVKRATLAAFAEIGWRFAEGAPINATAVAAAAAKSEILGFLLIAAECLAAVGRPRDALALLEDLQKRIDADPVLTGLPKRWRKSIWRRRLDLLGDGGVGACQSDAPIRAAAALRFPEDSQFHQASGTSGILCTRRPQ